MNMTDKERMTLITKIQDELCNIGDYVYPDHDVYINKTIERMEQMLGQLMQSFYDEHTYIKLRDNEDGEISYRYFEKGDVCALCRMAAQHYAWDDCDDTYSIVEIMCDGVELEYTGWQPGMVYEFREVESGKIVYSNAFPQWDH